MLKTLHVSNFKVIGDSISLPLKPLTVFIGRNGSGKSSIIEALDWLSVAINQGTDAATETFHRMSDLLHDHDCSRVFGLSVEYDPEDTSVGDRVIYALGAGCDDLRPEVAVVKSETLGIVSGSENRSVIWTTENTRVLRRVTTTQVRVGKSRKTKTEVSTEDSPFSDPASLALTYVDPGQFRGGYLLKDFLERAVFLRLNPRQIASFTVPRTKRSPRLLDEEGIRLAELLGELDEERLEILVEKLSSIIDGINNIETHKPQSPADRRFFTLSEARAGEEPYQVPAWVLSEGTRRMTAILALLLHDNPPPLLCIEEVENGLDPWTLEYLLQELSGAINRGTTQVILTTHSPYLLDMLGMDNVILCDRKEYGVEFYFGDRLPDTATLQLKMGLGALYTNRFLYQRENQGESQNNEDRSDL